MINRRTQREHMCILLFQKEFYDEKDMPEQMDLYLADVAGMTPELTAAMEERAAQIMEKAAEINGKIDQVSVGWRTARMGRVELAIMQVAVYEMLYDDEIPQSVAINEAVELTKKYCGEQSSGFVNAILGKLAS